MSIRHAEQPSPDNSARLGIRKPGPIAAGVKQAGLLAACAGLATCSILGQPGDNRAGLMRAMTARTAASPTVTRLATNSAARTASVEVKLPQDFRRYHILEKRSGAVQTATNLAAVSSNRFRANLTPESTLVFMEKDAPETAKPNATVESKALFSTFLLRSVPPTRAGEAQRTASGTLTLLADVPTPWNSASNAYVARLSVMFLSEDTGPTNALLPMAVEFSGVNVKDVQPRKVSLRTAGVDGSQEILVTCDRYRTDVAIAAYYQTTNTVRALTLQRLTAWDLTQMIVSVPMLFAALAGGLMGGGLRLFKGSHWNLNHVMHYLSEGALVGLVTVIMLLSGLLHAQIANLSGPPQLALAFSLAAAAGSVGSHFLDAAINRLRGKEKQAAP